MTAPELAASEVALLRRLDRERGSLHLETLNRRIYDRMRRTPATKPLLMERIDSWGMISPAGREYLAALDQGAP